MRKLASLENMTGRVVVDEDLKTSLIFLRDRVVSGGPCRVVSQMGRVFHLYTDASYENETGGLGGVLFDCNGVMLSFFSEEVSTKMVELLNPLGKETLIFELEALAVMVGVHHLLDETFLLPNDRIVIFLDNEAVLSRLIAGRADSTLDGLIFQSVLEWERSSGVCAWFERVASAANVADAPSRGSLDSFDPSLRVSIDLTDVVRSLVSRL
eukprot:s386_g11.t1